MTRQIALGAVVAFSVTVLALSVWEPKQVVTPAPAPVQPAQPPVQPAQPTTLMPGVKAFRPAMLRSDAVNRVTRNPVMTLQPLNQPALAVPLDAGAPVP